MHEHDPLHERQARIRFLQAEQAPAIKIGQIQNEKDRRTESSPILFDDFYLSIELQSIYAGLQAK